MTYNVLQVYRISCSHAFCYTSILVPLYNSCKIGEEVDFLKINGFSICLRQRNISMNCTEYISIINHLLEAAPGEYKRSFFIPSFKHNRYIGMCIHAEDVIVLKRVFPFLNNNQTFNQTSLSVPCVHVLF